MSASTLPSTGAVPVSHRGLFSFANVVVVQVLALAFLLSSFPVRNADFWTHLSIGRIIAQGDYRFGVDPLAYTTEGVYWANTSWLADLLMYFSYRSLGDSIVFLKAIFVVGIACALLTVRRRSSGIRSPISA